METDRRALLLGALGVAVAGCTSGGGDDPSPTPAQSTASPTPATPPDAALLTAWWLTERRLHDALPASYVPFRAAHEARIAAVEEHLRALGAPVPTAPAPKRIDDHTKAAIVASAGYLGDVRRAVSPDVAVLGAELAAGARQDAMVLAALPSKAPAT